MTPPSNRDTDRSSTERNQRRGERPDHTDPVSTGRNEQLIQELVDCMVEFENLASSLKPENQSRTENTHSSESVQSSDINAGTRRDEFIFPAQESSESESHRPASEADSDTLGDLSDLQELVEELQKGVSDVLSKRSSAQPTGESSEPQQMPSEDQNLISTEPEKLTSRGSDVASLPEIAKVLTKVINIVTSLSEDLQDTKRVNGALWEILNDLQVDVIELQRELARLETRWEDQEMEKGTPKQLKEQRDPSRQLSEQLNRLIEMYETDIERDLADKTMDQPAAGAGNKQADEATTDEAAAIDTLQEDIENIREELDEVREQAQVDQPSQQVSDLREEIEDVREAVAVVRDDLEDAKQTQGVGIQQETDTEISNQDINEKFRRLEKENEAIRELISGLHSRIN